MVLPVGFLVLIFCAYVEGSSGDLTSAVSFALCDDFDTSGLTSETFFKIGVIPKEPINGYSTIGFTIRAPFPSPKRLMYPIPQNQKKGVVIRRLTGLTEICLQALVVDTTVFVDTPTVFKTKCSEDDKAAVIPKCKKLEEEFPPARICPERLSQVLKDKGVITFIPTLPRAGSGNQFEPPIYDTTEDMTQASIAITDGLVEGGKKYINRYLTGLKNAKNTVKLSKIGGTLGNLKSFASAIGPFLGFAGGLATILTTFLTPNPFDALAEYLDKEFEALHSHLDRMQEELSAVITDESAKTRMKDTFQAIRFSLREYDDMVKSLSRFSVCGADQLLRNEKVHLFVEEFSRRDTDHHLRDLLEVEEGGLPLTGSLLKPMMKRYCRSNPSKLIQFVRDVTTYALFGTQARNAYEQIRCVKQNMEHCKSAALLCYIRPGTNREMCYDELRTCISDRNCEVEDEEEWKGELYRLLTRANALEVALTNPSKGLSEYFKFDIRSVLSTSTNKMKDASNYFVNNIMFDSENWPKHCILDERDNTVVTAVIKSNAPNDATKLNGAFGPSVGTKRRGRNMELIKLKIKHPIKGVDKGNTKLNGKKPHDWHTDNGNSVSHVTCDVGSVHFSKVRMTCEGEARYVSKHHWGGLGSPPFREVYWSPEDATEKDKLVYMELNPDTNEGYLEIKVQNSDVYYIPYRNGHHPRGNYILRMGCWKGNNRKKNYDCDRFFVLIPATGTDELNNRNATPVEFPVPR